MVSTDSYRLLRASLAVALLLVTLTYAVTRVFVLNFSTAGPNATALLSLLLVTGWTLPVAARLGGTRRERVLVPLATAGVAVSLLGDPVVALLGAALTGFALTPLLAFDVPRLRGRVGVGFALGLLLVAALRGITGTAPAYATTLGRVSLLALLLALVVVNVVIRRSDDPTPTESLPHVAPLFVALFLAALWLAYPTVSARWAGRSYLGAVALSTLGLLVGAGWVADRGAPAVRETLAWGGVLVVSLGALLTGSDLALAALAPATVALVRLAATGGRGETSPLWAGLGTVGAQLEALVLVVGVVLAVNWAFIPGVGPLLEGLEPALVLLLAGLVAAVAALAARGGAPAAVDPDDTRRALVASVAAGLVGTAGALVRAPRPGERAIDDLRVATYNVHQFFDAGGAYNLEALARLLRNRELGIVGLQETEGARISSGNVHGVRWLADTLGYHYAPGPDTRVGGYGVSLLSRWPIRDVTVVEPPTADSVTRPAMRATVDHPDGAFTVVVAHLETEGEIRVRQARRVVDLVGNVPRAVVLGDFNATPDEAVYETMTETFTDVWAAAGEGDGSTFSASRPRQRIDYVFVRGFDPIEATVFGGPDESDHRGVGATLERA